MRVYIDETGDPHPNAQRPFAVGALFVDDADQLVVTAIDKLGCAIGSLQQHASHDSDEERNAFLAHLDRARVPFWMKIIGYDYEANDQRPAAEDLHRRAVALAAGISCFLPQTEILVSGRDGSLRQSVQESVIRDVRGRRWSTVLNTPELRLAVGPDAPSVQVIEDQNSLSRSDRLGLQICDHLLWRWQRAISSSSVLEFPSGSMIVQAVDDRISPHLTVANCSSNGFCALTAAEQYSRARASLPNATGNPLQDSYRALAANGETSWTDEDRRLIWLLLNEPQDRLLGSEAMIAELAYWLLEGRTRWRSRFDLSAASFGLLADLAAGFLTPGAASRGAAPASFDAFRYTFRSFRSDEERARFRAKE